MARIFTSPKAAAHQFSRNSLRGLGRGHLSILGDIQSAAVSYSGLRITSASCLLIHYGVSFDTYPAPLKMTDPRTGSAWILGDKFNQVYPHLGSIDALWNKKWKFPCERSLYPFHDGKYEDFAPIFDTLIKKQIHDGYSVEYTKEFIATAEALVKQADELAGSDEKAAIALYLRACAVYRIARFPYINSDVKREVYEAQKRAYLKAASLFECPIKDVVIPHTAGNERDGKEVPLYVRFPKGASKESPCPALLLMCGLDGHRRVLPDLCFPSRPHRGFGPWLTEQTKKKQA